MFVGVDYTRQTNLYGYDLEIRLEAIQIVGYVSRVPNR